MRFHLSTLSILASLSAAVWATEFLIGVGKDEVTGLPGIGFDPSRTVTQSPGDTLVFSFLQGSHQVVQSDFHTPCVAAGGFDSGLQLVANGTLEGGGPTFNTTVTNSSTILWFSDLGNNLDNCYQGAVFCVNTDESANSTQTCADFKAAALALGTAAGVAPSVRSNTPFSATPTSKPVTSTTTGNATGTITSSPTSTSSNGSKSRVGRMAKVGWGVGAVLLGIMATVV